MSIEAHQVTVGTKLDDGRTVTSKDFTCQNEWIEIHLGLDDGTVLSAAYYGRVQVTA